MRTEEGHLEKHGPLEQVPDHREDPPPTSCFRHVQGTVPQEAAVHPGTQAASGRPEGVALLKSLRQGML